MPAETWAIRSLRGVKVNSVTTHVGIGDILAYDLSVGADKTTSTDAASDTTVKYNTVSVSQAAGLNNVTCLTQQCSQPLAQSAGSVTPTTGQAFASSSAYSLWSYSRPLQDLFDVAQHPVMAGYR